MSDITSRNLEAAILDQKVAGVFAGKRYAFVAVYDHEHEHWALGVAVENEDGYSPISGKMFNTSILAMHWAHELNAHIGLTHDEATRIVVSTMRRHHAIQSGD